MFLWDLITSYYLNVMVLFCSKSCWQCLCLCTKHVWLSFLINSLEFQNKLLIGAPSISRKKLPWLYENHCITTLVETYLALGKTNEGLATFLKKKKKKKKKKRRRRETEKENIPYRWYLSPNVMIVAFQTQYPQFEK